MTARKRVEAGDRERKAVRLFVEEARTIDEIMEALDLTRRCVERAIRDALRAAQEKR